MAAPTSLADAGRCSEANREELARGVGKYVAPVPMSAIAEVKTEVLSRPGRYRTIQENLLGPKRWWAMGSGVAVISSASIPKRPSARR